MNDEQRHPVATDLEVAALADHPKNDKLMTPGEMKKLRANIEKNGGQFPRLVVRELDQDSEYWSEDGPNYQILDGHQRKKLLMDMGYDTVPVDIWTGISDEDALRNIATLDKIKARSIPLKRALLLNELEETSPDLDLDDYLMEDPEERQRYHLIMEVENQEDEETQKAMEEAADKADKNDDEWVTRELILPKSAADVWDEAVKHIRNQLSGKNKTGQAAEYMAAIYLAGTRVVNAEMAEALRDEAPTDTGDGDATPQEG